MKMKWCMLYFNLMVFSSTVVAKELSPYTVYIKAGAVLETLDGKSKIFLDKGIYAKVLEEDPLKRDIFQVYDKRMKPKYEVLSQYIVEIAEDTKLLPNLDPQKVYPPQSVFQIENTIANYETQFNFHVDSLQLAELNEIYNDKISYILSYRYEMRTLFTSTLPFLFGASLNYQAASWTNEFETINLTILSLGPTFKYKRTIFDNITASAVVGGEFAPVYKGASSKLQESYTALIYDLGAEAEWKTAYGNLSLGTHFRHHYLTLDKTNRESLKTTPKEYSLSSLGAMIGYRFEWSL